MAQKSIRWEAPAGYPTQLVTARDLSEQYFRENYQRFGIGSWTETYLRLAHIIAGLVCLIGAIGCVAGLVAIIRGQQWDLWRGAFPYEAGGLALTLILLSGALFLLAGPSLCGPSGDERQETWIAAEIGAPFTCLDLWRNARIYCGEGSANVLRLGMAKNRWAFVLVPAGMLLSLVPILSLPWEGYALSAGLSILVALLWLIWWRMHFLFYNEDPETKAPDEYLPLRVLLSDIKVLLDLPD